MIRKLKSKKVMFLLLLLFFSTLIMGLSYGVFTISTSNYNATNLLISDLNYGLTIREDGNTSNISDRTVTVPSNTLAYFNITITSINKIDSKYNLAYKTNSNALVEYTDRTSWTSTGVIESYDNMVYTRKVRVVIDNLKNESSSQVEFGVFGGYSFNTISSIDLGNGFLTVGGPYKELSSVTSKRLVDIIESDTECVTETNCLYGGGSLNNYLQYPTSENKDENIWRITGSYNIDNSVVAKIVGDIQSQTNKEGISNSLNIIYNTLERKDIIHKTNKFNCSEVGCNDSSYNNIGLISTYEYNKIGGINSYLATSNSFYSLNNNTLQNITQSGVEETNETTNSGLRPVIYLDTNIKVTGSGTSNDPYRISEQSDINLIAYTLDGAPTDKTYEWLLDNKIIQSITCEKGTKAEWSYKDYSIKMENVHIPDYCTINFGDDKTLANMIFIDATKKKYARGERSSFGTYTINGLHEAEDYGDTISYYYTGNPDNWVKFAGHLWRIIRINGDGSIRLLFAGSGASDANIGESVFQNYSSTIYAGYAGWKYGNLDNGRGENLSTIYTYLKEWYDGIEKNGKAGLSETDKKYIDTNAIYCNDRELATGSYDSEFTYKTNSRLINYTTPTFLCDVKDQFKDGFGLMTADEIVYAGGNYLKGNSHAYYYLNKLNEYSSGSWWTMSPQGYNGKISSVFYASSNTTFAPNETAYPGSIYKGQVFNKYYVRPVISLKKDVRVTGGDGSGTNPYTLALP